MLGNLKISTRLILLIIVQIVVLVAIASIGLASVNVSGDTMERLNGSVQISTSLSRLGGAVRSNLIATVDDMLAGTITWEEGSERLTESKQAFEEAWRRHIEPLSADEREFAQDLYGPSIEDLQTAFAELESIFQSRSRERLNLFFANEFASLVDPFFDALSAQSSQQEQIAAEDFRDAQQTNQFFLTLTGLGFIIGIVIAGVLGFFIYRSISQPVARLAHTVHEVSAGNYDVRSEVNTKDELGELSQAFDTMLQERVATLSAVQRENDQLNESVISLLQAVSQLSQRDLTVRVPVTEDVTGPVADALNLLTGETSKVLSGVTRISEQVARASSLVKAQSDAVIAVATNERQEVEKTARDLTSAATAMNQIAELAKVCNEAADRAIKTTQTALETVTNTVNGINQTRDTIRETEKRIKRLGERSQEISGAVNLINSIAERTHILALNASMHAASAGEAGRGFAVVADEVQRLAENARQATSQIATLVTNIQAETAETVTAMNTAISQVVEGSRLAEQAGEQMRRTQASTSDLVGSVQQIAASSLEQARASNALLDRARQIQESARQTSQQLEEQTVHTNNLVEYSKGLVESVRLFKLPHVGAQAEAA